MATRRSKQRPDAPAVILVGAGRRGRQHARLWDLAGGRVVAVVDEDEGHAGALAKARRIQAFGCLVDAAGALPDAAIVDISTPPASHRELALAAIALDRHVLCEKPFVFDAAEAEEVMAAAKARSRHVVVMHNWLYRPAIRRTLNAIEAGKLGRVVAAHLSYTDSHLLDTKGIAIPYHWVHTLAGGRLEESLPHLIYVILAVLGDTDLQVRSVETTKLTPYPWVAADTLQATFVGESALATIFMTFAGGAKRTNLQVVGSERNAEANTNTNLFELVGSRHLGKPKLEIAEKLITLTQASAKRMAAAAAVGVDAVAGRWESPDIELMKRFLSCVRDGSLPPISPESVIATVRLTREVVDAMKSKAPVA